MLTKSLIAKYSQLNVIDDELFLDVRSSAKVYQAKKGTLIFTRGKVLEHYYFLLKGDVNLIGNDFSVERVQALQGRGLKSLNLNSPTQVSAIAKSTVNYFTLPRLSVDKWVTGVKRLHTEPQDLNDASSGEGGMEVGELDAAQDWMSRILSSPVFSRIPSTRLQELFAKFEKVEVAKGERVLKEGAPGDYFYVIASGKALVSNRTGAFEVYLKEGDYFGEEALLSQSPRNATVTMLSDGVLKCLNKDDFNILIKEPVLRYLSLNQVSSMKKPYKILDVRLPIEHRAGHTASSVNVPLSRLRESVGDLAYGCVYAVSDEAGARADIAAYLLCQAGFDAVVLSTAESSPDQAASCMG